MTTERLARKLTSLIGPHLQVLGIALVLIVGQVTFVPDTILADGTYSVHVALHDLLGNVSPTRNTSFRIT